MSEGEQDKKKRKREESEREQNMLFVNVSDFFQFSCWMNLRQIKTRIGKCLTGFNRTNATNPREKRGGETSIARDTVFWPSRFYGNSAHRLDVGIRTRDAENEA